MKRPTLQNGIFHVDDNGTVCYSGKETEFFPVWTWELPLSEHLTSLLAREIPEFRLCATKVFKSGYKPNIDGLGKGTRNEYLSTDEAKRMKGKNVEYKLMDSATGMCLESYLTGITLIELAEKVEDYFAKRESRGELPKMRGVVERHILEHGLAPSTDISRPRN
jgi:hypothetical protein